MHDFQGDGGSIVKNQCISNYSKIVIDYNYFAKKVINYCYDTPIFEAIDYNLLLGKLQMGL